MKVIFTRRLLTMSHHFVQTVTSKCGAALVGLLLLFQSAQAQDIYAVSGANLIAFKAENPGIINFSISISGIAAGQTIEGLDFRPATGQLYALGYVASSGVAQVYRIDYKTGVATAMGSTAQLAANMVRIGMDFNPTVDRIRVTSFGGQNYRLHPDLGTIVATDGNLNYATGDVHAGVPARIEAVAYTNSYFGGTPTLVTATTLYYYDYAFDDIINSSNPNGGVLNTVGNTGIATISGNGLDMDIMTNPTTGMQMAYVTANVSGTTNMLYTVNLATGKASSQGTIGSGISISEMAVFLAPPPQELIYAISGGNLISVNSNAPATVLNTRSITGITTGQVIEGLDFRPATGQLYALGYEATSGMTQVYTVDTLTGTATSVGAAIMLAANMTNVAMDFNPMADRIRVTSANGQNYRLVPTTGALAFTDGNLAYANGDIRGGNTPAVAAVAYTNSVAGATSTTIYYYDFGLNSLALSTNPNGGVLTTVGVTGITPANATGLDMDISSNPGINPNTAFLSANTGTSNSLYSLNLTTGNARLLGNIGSGGTITDFAVYVAPPTPSRTIYAISGSSLIKFNSITPGSVTTIGAISGITGGQTIEGLDFRPATLGLYAVGYNTATGATEVYTVDTTSGAATSVGAAVLLPSGMSRLGVDFNPMADRIRVTSSTGQNYRLNPINGTIAATDLALNYVAGDASVVAVPNINAVGYTNNMSGATTTSIYYYDYMLDVLATTSLPNNGALNTVGRTGIITASGNGLDMDIVRDPVTGANTAFLSANVSGTTSNLYTVNLATGEAALIGAIGAAAGITEMAVRLSNTNGGGPILPVTLVNFAGSKAGSNSHLSWTTQTEINNSYFMLERSVDGMKFSAISGKINSAAVDGNSTQSLNYYYNDLAPVKGINYYRLLQTDKDARTTYSKTIQLQFNGGYEITMYPNPVSNVLNVAGFASEKADLQIKMTDVNGRIINTTTLKNQQGNWTTQVNAERLPAGIYYITVVKNNMVIHTQSVQKQ